MTLATHNALINETSPYLLQHAENPVAWYPWGAEALDLARTSGRPILLSVGYSACHWCHVMAHESFEDEATAKLMNQYFVNIKVDREERPDIDKIYQLAHQLLTQRPGGWPLTMFLTPNDQTPFFGGTYFPPTPRYGMPAFRDLLLRVVDFLANDQGDVSNQNASLRAAFVQAETAPPQDPALALFAGAQVAPPVLGPELLYQAREKLAAAFDAQNGGFGRAPKFPHPTNIERLLRHYAAGAGTAAPDTESLHMALTTLEQMARGGVYDHVAGGFFRYSTDDEWTIPHFEKMLYDNGPLLEVYSHAYQLTGTPRFADAANGTARWVIDAMQSPEGGYFSSLDADSEGEEGKFYVWDPAAVEAALSADEYAVVDPLFGLARPPNFEERHWHLNIVHDEGAVGAQLGLDRSRVIELRNAGLARLQAIREQRVRPDRDEKILTSWNALMISGMSRAARVFQMPAYIESAERALAFVRTTMWQNGRLLATYKDGRAHLNAYLDDYAFLLKAILDMLESRWRSEDLAWAVELGDVLLDQYEDKQSGGFFFTSNDHETLIHRTRSFSDDALPNGNAIAASAFLRLGHLIGEPRYLDAAERTLQAGLNSMQRAPHGHTALLDALDDYLHPPPTVVIRGPGAGAAWLTRAHANYAPRRSAVFIPDHAKDLPGLLESRSATGSVTAYLCSGLECQAPITDSADYEARLAEMELDAVTAARR